MRRRWLFTAVLAAGTALAQQNIDISGNDFNSGASDARLAALGHQAAESGKRLVITAPKYWHARIAARIRAGGKADIVLRDGFYENILVRVENEPPAEVTARPDVRRETRPAARPAPAVKARSAGQSIAKPATARPPRSLSPAGTPDAIAHGSPHAAPASAATPVPASAAVKTRPAAGAANHPVEADASAIRQRFETSLNQGRPAAGPLSPANLLPGDMIFVDPPVRAVVRREGLNPQLFWLDGELDLRRTELRPLGDHRYRVAERLRTGEFTLRKASADASAMLDAGVPAVDSPERARLEKAYNDGRTIDQALAPGKLRHGDLFYTGTDAAVVIRRDGANLLRYWLSGPLDLRQAALQKEGSNKYRVVGTPH
ncbi:MAG TPA: hypothetical protein VFG55_01400 [Rhodanobacteraceae bacterium]|nr:hypothetical protein [Rhodanobacteraceae bacterium]